MNTANATLAALLLAAASLGWGIAHAGGRHANGEHPAVIQGRPRTAAP